MSACDVHVYVFVVQCASITYHVVHVVCIHKKIIIKKGKKRKAGKSGKVLDTGFSWHLLGSLYRTCWYKCIEARLFPV